MLVIDDGVHTGSRPGLVLYGPGHRSVPTLPLGPDQMGRAEIRSQAGHPILEASIRSRSRRILPEAPVQSDEHGHGGLEAGTKGIPEDGRRMALE